MRKGRPKDNIYKRENGIYAFRYQDENGVWREKYTGERDKGKAKAVKVEVLASIAQKKKEIAEGTLPTEMAEWHAEQAAEWWNEYRKPRIAEGTNLSEPYIVKHLPRIIGNKRLLDFTNQDLDDYVTARLAGYEYQSAEGKKGLMAKVGPWSINKEVRLWRQILKKANLWNRLAAGYKREKQKASDIGQALTREQLHHLAEVAETNRDWEAAFYASVLAANTGLRGGEVKKLKLGSINVELRRIKIFRADAKTDSSARTIELNRDATEAAARLLLRANLLGCNQPGHYLMPKNLSRIARGKYKGGHGYDPLQHQGAWDSAWASLTQKAGLPKFRFHDLRHTFISFLVEAGVSMPLIQAIVGHISKRMVLHYTHVTSGAARRAVELLDSHSVLEPTLTGSITGPTPTKIQVVIQ